MHLRPIIGGVLLAFVAMSAPAPAQAETGWSYIATAGGSLIRLADGTVTSDLTAQSAVTGGPTGRSSTNTVATVDVKGLLRTGVINTGTSSSDVPDGIQVRSTAETAGLDVLSGLITADAVKTTAITTGTSTATSVSGGTEFVNLKIAGVNLPVDIPHNYSVTIPNVAQISINGLISGEKDGGRATQAWGLAVVLLKEQGGTEAGARITVNPMFQMVVPVDPAPGARLAGNAYGSRVTSEADGKVTVTSGPTAAVRTPYTSSNGETLTNNTAAVNIPGLLTTAAVGSTSVSSLSGTSDADVVNTNEIAELNLLNGLVTADALKVTAHGNQTDGTYRGDLKMTLLNLQVAGETIPVDVAPNTVIDVAGLGRVVVNQQIKFGKVNIIRGVHITLDTEQAGLPVGAKIELAVASTAIL